MSPSKEEDASAPPPTGKIAIKGFSLSSKPSTSKPGASLKKPAPPSNLGKRSRGGFGHDSDSDDDDHRNRNTHEAVTGFGVDGAIAHVEEEQGNGSARKGGELVIKKMPNRDWRAEASARRMKGTGKDLLPAEERAMREGKGRQTTAVEGDGEGKGKQDGVDVVNGNDGEIQWGLSVRKRARTEEGDEAQVGQADGDREDHTFTPNLTSADNIRELETAQTSKPTPAPTADEEALASLLGTSTTTTTRPDLIIPTPLTEQEAYKAAVASAPDPSTLEDYERIPVEEFGAALLRGMGWKGEKNADPSKKREVKRRQNLLGLGAKELDGAEELGAWVQKSDIKRLNPGGGGGGGRGGSGGGDRRPKAGEYKREKERERERREERAGGGYRREKERERERERERDRHREYRR